MWLRALTLLAVLPLLSACYLPARFDAEIDLRRTGLYSIEFIGYIAEINLYRKLHEGSIDKEEENERREIIENDFRRDESTKEVSYFQKGHFKVHWVKKGDLVKNRFVTFFRRNENMISLSMSPKTGAIDIRGKYLKKQDKDRLVKYGLWMEGEVRVKTDTKIVDHNATQVIEGEGREKTLIWRITSPYDPSPKLKLFLY